MKPFVDQRARGLRQEYAQRHTSDDIDLWRRTIFCDEAILRTNGAVRTWLWRKPGEEGLPDSLAPRLFSTRKTVMVWAAVGHGGRTELRKIEKTEFSGPRGGVSAMDYQNQITSGPLESAWKDIKTRWRGYGMPRILEDNVKVHTSAINRSVGVKKKFSYLDHPPYSPDLNPIETAWALLKRELAKVAPRPTTPDSLFAEAQRIRMAIDQDKLDRMVDSMMGRMQMVMNGGGYPIAY